MINLKIRWITVILVVVPIMVWMLTCFTLVRPGYVGVVVDLFGNEKGVEAKELHVGMHWIAPWKKIYQFPIFEQNITWEDESGFNFQTKEGMAVHGDVGITFHLDPKFVPVIFQRYRRGMDEISHVFIRNYIRDALNVSASKVEIEYLYSAGKEQFFVDVQRLVQNDLRSFGIEVSRIYLMGRFGFPQGVIAALNAKIEATQRAQQRENELREAEAEAKKRIACAEGEARCCIVKAQAEAESNSIISESISFPLIEWLKVSKWDGRLPQVSSDATPLISMGGLKQ